MNERSFIFVAVMRVRDEQKERSIREKALEMIVQEGFDGFSMQKLAKAADVSPATIYIYYKNREDLLTQLYNDVQQVFTEVTLKNFDPSMSLSDGLWLQWKNRFHFILDYPVYFQFFEQFRNSPCINHKNIERSKFKENMRQFLQNAIKRGELKKMDPEVFWSVAYGSFYAMVKFHLKQNQIMSSDFKLTDAKLKHFHQMILNALKT